MATPSKQGDLAVEHFESVDEKTANKQSNAEANGNINLLDDEGNVRRIPVPSSDPNDPLNMNKWRKFGVVVCCCWYSIFSLVLVGGAGPILPFWIQEYAPEGLDVTEIVKLTTYPSLVMALGKSLNPVAFSTTSSTPLTSTQEHFSSFRCLSSSVGGQSC
jgi:hypothetical protein